jgi:DNA-binding response OmpR family regulator
MRRVTQQWSAAPIVLMEDDPNDAFFVCQALKTAGIVNRLLQFQTAREAREYFAEPQRVELPVLFVMDVNLVGGETGIDFLRWLRKQRTPLGATPTMVLTGSDRIADRDEAELLGSIYFLQKPVSEETLTAALQSLGFLLTTLSDQGTARTIERRL